ncbi:MAG: SCP2 sterol-binding domain-containing protein [Aeropyrum sp.]|nr:SCP2 sterol-binding domain-containing protein [Aeropyrum sp.]MCE4616576.1 SCP2 sterol-binding domain-containing protein [Aeropyrum sp.]
MAELDQLKKRFEEIFEKAKQSMPEIQSWNKVYQIVLEDGGEFYIEISNGELKLVDGKHPSPIATLTTTSETLSEILEGKLDAMRAFMSKKLRITGNVLDTMNLKRLIDTGLGKA